MTRNTLFAVFGILIFILVVSFVLDFRAKKYYFVHSPKIDKLEIEARELHRLKTMFRKSRAKALVNYLKSLKTPQKEYKRGGVWILEFSGLDQNSLGLFTRKIENSPLNLKSFRILREKEKASLRLEINI